MMNFIKYFTFLILIYMVCSARSCESEADAQAMAFEESNAKLLMAINSLEREELDSISLIAFEEKGFRLLRDLESYIAICLDTSYNGVFREASYDRILEIFKDSLISIRLGDSNGNTFHFPAREKLFSEEPEYLKDYSGVRFSDFKIDKGFHKSGPDQYTATLSFSSTSNLSTEQEMTEGNQNSARMILTKSFNSNSSLESGNYWKLFISEITPAQ